MSESRISLSRILAVNWYGFRQILDVSNDTLISGTFGTGKSALLDLMQHVMLGEHWRPNRAAAGNARGRSLVSYCLCDTNTLREGEAHYTRSSGVTLVGMEFSWPKEAGKAEPRRETWGVRIEYSSPTAEPKRTYFLIPQRVEWNDLAPNGQMLDEEAFRTWVRREFGREFLFARQQDYLAEMATPRHLYFDADQFRKTFPKAIAFEPEENVEKFIREFILEESPLDVRDVQAAVGAYRETQARLDKQEEEAGFLRIICRHHANHTKGAREAAIHGYTISGLEHARLKEQVDKQRAELKALEDRNAEDNAAFEAKSKERDLLSSQLSEFIIDTEDAQLEVAQMEKVELLREVNALQEARNSVHERLRNRAFTWTNWLRHGATLKVEGLKAALEVDPSLLDALRSEDEIAGMDALPALTERFNEIFRATESLLNPLARQLDAENAALQKLAQDLDRLERNETPGSFPLFQAVKTRFAASPQPPEQLCRLVEIKPDQEDWRQALEMFIGRNRFAIVVAPTDYREALDLLRKTASRGEPESLIHPREAGELRVEVKKGSLAEKVHVQHATAARFVQHLLGNVMAVETVDDLDRCERGITREGIFKQTPIRRRQRGGNEPEFTLGAEGIKQRKAAYIRQQKDLMASRDHLQMIIASVKHWLDEGKHGGLSDPRLPDRSGELQRIPQLEEKLQATSARIDFLSTPERAQRLERRKSLERQRDAAIGALGGLGAARQNYQQRRKELLEAVERLGEELEDARLELEEARLSLPGGIVQAELQADLDSLLANRSKWPERIETARRLMEASREAAAQALKARDLARRDLVGNERHPEYRHDFQVEEPGNEAWDGRLRLLEETELPKFRALAQERRKDWERRLRESVLDRLNERLKDAERTVRQLRSYLDRDIGKHRYRISQKRDPAFGPLWKLLDSGFEPNDELLMASRSGEVQEALGQLMAAVENADQADDRARRLLDYRQYHRYDLEMAQANRPDAPAISLGRSGRNLSGGENQAPFFISMLAAFHRVYDMGSSRAQHLGLVVMDEAFSKLSGDGVEDCLTLARNFHLQIVLAFPPEKLGIMAPYSDTIIMCQKREERDAAGYVTRIDNIPILLTPQQVQEALE